MRVMVVVTAEVVMVVATVTVVAMVMVVAMAMVVITDIIKNMFFATFTSVIKIIF
jgi:hypothetical protein